MIYRMSLPDGRYEYVSPASVTLFGYSPDEFYKSSKLIQEIIHPDWQTYFEDQWTKLVRGEMPPIYEYQIIDKKGETKWLNQRNAMVFDKNNKPIAIEGIVTDITQLKNAERKAVAERNKTQQYLDIAEVMLVSVELSGTVKLINQKGCEVLGYSEEEIVGQNWFDNFLPERLRENVKEVSKKVYAGEMESVKYFENEILTKAGKERLIGWHNALLKDYKGNIIGTLSSGEDITERKKAEDALKISEERFELAMSASKDGLFDWNLITNEIYYSPGWKSMLGYTEDELPNDFSIWENLTEADHVKKSWKMQQEVINKQRDRFEIEFKMKHKDEHWVDILSQAEAVFDESGNAVRIVGTHADITERKQAEEKLQQSEEKFRLLTETANDYIIIHDMNGKLIYVNRSAEEQLGYSFEESLKMSVQDIIPKEHLAKLYENRDRRQAKDISHNVFEIEVISKAGERIPLEISSTPFIKDGKVDALFIIARNIAERKLAEKELAKHREQLEELVKERTKELEEKNKKLDNAMKVFVGRELTIRDLQKRIRALEGK